VATAVAVKRGPSAEASPHPTDLLKGFGPGPFLEGLLADGEQDSTTALALGAHGKHASLALGVGAAAARNALVLDDLAVEVMLRLDDAAKVCPAVYAGVGALAGDIDIVLVEMRIMILNGWVRMGCARLLCGHEAFPFVVRASGRLGPPRRLPTLSIAVLSHVCIEESIHLG
jgi:hypothetical protein